MNAVLLQEEDNVATVTEEIPAGASAACVFGDTQVTVTAGQNIPIYHKIAVKPIRKGERVIKYGEQIGIAQTDIRPGDHVHTHNLSSK
jgi:altronate dehydratase small subunit